MREIEAYESAKVPDEGPSTPYLAIYKFWGWWQSCIYQQLRSALQVA